MKLNKILTVSALVFSLSAANVANAGDSFGFFYSKDGSNFSYSNGFPFHPRPHYRPHDHVVEHHHFYHEPPRPHHHHHHHHHHHWDD
ncbi:hypothetical protein [Succinivibrio dextrinosolvens]|uniref:hypothetical protein n=1 Tax=Succinivibrio dextrinosolvens TaxID=83771 RepID=UPI00247B0DF6|nr:hypothetical protein [Succinivibrio dextrinosolvens]